MTFWDRIFSHGRDFIALLEQQAEAALEAARQLRECLESPARSSLDDIEKSERQADKVRIQLNEELAEAMETPLDREDTSSFSNRLDDITDAIKFCALVMDALRATPDAAMKRMMDNVIEGLGHMRASLGHLPDELEQAQKENRETMSAQRRNQHVYVEALGAVLDDDDSRSRLTRYETFRQLLRIGEQLQLAARELEHAIQKLQ